MASQQACGKCEKTVYATEKQEAGAKWYHKGCFKCSDAECNIQLTLKTFKVVEGSLYCEKHLPKPKATAVTDSVQMQTAINAPKKSTEGLAKTIVGTGEVPNVGIDSVLNAHALSAPKKPVENIGNVQKGSLDNLS